MMSSPDNRRGGEWLDHPAQRSAACRLRQPVVGNKAKKEQRAEKRHLIRLHQHHAGRDAGEQSIPERRAVERARKQPERNREEHEAFDLSDMLDAPRRRSAEHEGERRNDAAGRMPAPVAEEHQHRQPAEREQRRTPRRRARGSSDAARAARAAPAARRSATADRRSAERRRTRSVPRTATAPDESHWRETAARPGTAPWRHTGSSRRRRARATTAHTTPQEITRSSATTADATPPRIPPDALFPQA